MKNKFEAWKRAALSQTNFFFHKEFFRDSDQFFVTLTIFENFKNIPLLQNVLQGCLYNRNKNTQILMKSKYR